MCGGISRAMSPGQHSSCSGTARRRTTLITFLPLQTFQKNVTTQQKKHLFRKLFFIESILTKLTTMGALYLTLVCLMPEFLISKYPIPFYLGGTSVLIVVVVAMDTVSQVQTRLMSQQYESLIKKTRFGK